jgi:hypothetical protein
MVESLGSDITIFKHGCKCASWFSVAERSNCSKNWLLDINRHMGIPPPSPVPILMSLCPILLLNITGT